jgi:DNA topoisomerase I
MATMIIAEKKKAAQSIAEALGKTTLIPMNKSLKVFYVQSKDVYVIPLRGHIMQYANTEEYAKWTSHDPREIITNPAAIEKKPSNYAGGFISALKKIGRKCTQCIIGTDADAEGCNIGMIDAFPFVKAVNPSINVMQLWLNDLQTNSIKKGYNNLIAPKWSWANSAEARAKIDAIIGFSATREISLSLKPILTHINVQFTSIGRVQTSLLYLLYLREQIIRNFIASTFWAISASCKIHQLNFNAHHTKNNFTNVAIATKIFAKIKDVKEGELSSLKVKLQKILPPTPLNTSKALVLLTKHLKITSSQALKTMESLYLNKIISYPRTDSDIYSKTYPHSDNIKKFSNHSQFGNYSNKLIQNQQFKPRNGKVNAGDHSPITPLVSLEQSSTRFENSLQRNVYDLITRSYLATFGQSAEDIKAQLIIMIKGEPFISDLIFQKKKGFLDIAPFLSKKYHPSKLLGSIGKLCNYNIMNELFSRSEFILDKIEKKKIFVNKTDIEEKLTQPPPRYNDATLLKLMDQKKLGTKSTRPNIIQILIDRNYVERKKRFFFVKELGFILIDTLKEIWLPFLKPEFTAYVEKKLEDIREEKLRLDSVVSEITNKFLELFDKFRQNKTKILSLMTTIKQTGNVIRGRDNKILSKNNKGTKNSKNSKNSPYSSKEITIDSLCPKCKTEKMNIVKTKTSQFIACANRDCKTYLSLPKKGSIYPLKSKCSICSFNIVKIDRRSNGKKFSYYICPFCWNSGLKEASGKGFCSKCEKFKINNSKCIQK